MRFMRRFRTGIEQETIWARTRWPKRPDRSITSSNNDKKVDETVTAEYEVIRCRPEHKAMVADLQKELLSSDDRLNTRYLEWKYEKTPDRRDAFIYLACHQGKPVGMRGFHEAMLEAGTPTQAFPVLIAGDALISAPHRNRGLVARIMRLAEKDLAQSGYPYFVSVGGANRVNMLGLLTLGWRSAGQVQPVGRVTTRARAGHGLSRVLARQRVLWKFNWTRLLASADQHHPFRNLDAANAGSGREVAPAITLERSPRVDAMAELIERLGHDGRIRYRRDREYLDWRFRDPTKEYRFLYWEESRLEGYLVLSRLVSDLGGWYRVYIADLEATDIKIRSALLSAAMSYGRFPELVTWTASLADAEVRLLDHHGFVPVDHVDTSRGCPSILVRLLGNDLPREKWEIASHDLLDIRNWDIRVLYSMRA